MSDRMPSTPLPTTDRAPSSVNALQVKPPCLIPPDVAIFFPPTIRRLAPVELCGESGDRLFLFARLAAFQAAIHLAVGEIVHGIIHAPDDRRLPQFPRRHESIEVRFRYLPGVQVRQMPPHPFRQFDRPLIPDLRSE